MPNPHPGTLLLHPRGYLSLVDPLGASPNVSEWLLEMGRFMSASILLATGASKSSKTLLMQATGSSSVSRVSCLYPPAWVRTVLLYLTHVFDLASFSGRCLHASVHVLLSQDINPCGDQSP